MILTARIHEARRLLAAVEKNHSPAAFSCNFGAEDMVVLDLIARDGLNVRAFMVDTGLLPAETHALRARVRREYGMDIEAYHPWPGTIDAHVEQYGIDGFRDNLEARRASQAIRVAEPLRRALSGRRAWITGHRRGPDRPDLEAETYDSLLRVRQFNPLADWPAEDVSIYVNTHRIPHASFERAA